MPPQMQTRWKWSRDQAQSQGDVLDEAVAQKIVAVLAGAATGLARPVEQHWAAIRRRVGRIEARHAEHIEVFRRSAKRCSRWLTAGWRAARDVAFPARCPITHLPTHAAGALQAEIWAATPFIKTPFCAACGMPLEAQAMPFAKCGACEIDPHRVERIRAACAYQGVARDLTLAMKHGGDRNLARIGAVWMRAAGEDLLAEADFLAPTPLHWSRLAARGYNQAQWLATALGRLSGKPVRADLLIRRRRTPSQGGLSRLGRQRNVAGAFAVTDRRAIAGRRVLLVDDVLTTGATLDACALTLLRAGAIGVDAITLARVVRPEIATI